MVLRAGFQRVLSAVYPARCLSCGAPVESDFGLCGTCWRSTGFIGGTICDVCGTPLPGESPNGGALLCDACLKNPRDWVQGRAALLYRETGRKLVLALKHGDRQEIARPAAGWMQQALKDIVLARSIVAPVPLHRWRLLRRRYNQSALLGAELSVQLDRVWCPDLLHRTRRTPSLDGMTAAEREVTLNGAIAVHPGRKPLLLNRPVLLVDDVMTSGATLGACARACLAAGSGPVRVVVLARVAKDD
jgi:predicted amidophosphoribosyltransferase